MKHPMAIRFTDKRIKQEIIFSSERHQRFGLALIAVTEPDGTETLFIHLNNGDFGRPIYGLAKEEVEALRVALNAFVEKPIKDNP